MKTTSILIASAALFAALGLAIPVPASSETVQIVVKTGDGDSAVGLSVTLNRVFSTADNLGASKGVAATVGDSNVICQTFSDNAGTIPLGSPFTEATPASFSATSNGGTGSKLEDAVPIGAFFCSNSADGLPKPSGSNLPSTASARVQLEIESDTFIQRDVPVDGSIFQIQTTGLDLSIVTATDVDVDKISCQAFADVAAKKPVGGPATSAKDAILTANRNQPTAVNAIVCSA
ncbi:hypothetical protein MMC07_003394 [Pseudocyphellaria aurata]|nr:hypothetical protein [Pseudocyphellaria aurata]